jgi:hypothetical protein
MMADVVIIAANGSSPKILRSLSHCWKAVNFLEKAMLQGRALVAAVSF